MSDNKKENQKILVNGEPFLWKVKSHWEFTSIIIQHELEKHKYIISSIESGLIQHCKTTPQITPCMIKDVIMRAIEKGWDPLKKSGGPMYVQLQQPKSWDLKQFWDIRSN